MEQVADAEDPLSEQDRLQLSSSDAAIGTIDRIIGDYITNARLATAA